jgi:hypothetical protein
VSVWVETARGRTVTGHAPTRADRLLIRPANGRQAGTGNSSPGHITRKTPAKQGHPLAESQAKSTGTNLTTAPDGTATDSQSSLLKTSETARKSVKERTAFSVQTKTFARTFAHLSRPELVRTFAQFLPGRKAVESIRVTERSHRPASL